MQSIAKWEIFEQQLTSEQAFANPFLDVDFQAVLTCGKQQHRIDGFYDGIEEGRHIWRFRFAPMQEGNWQYETRSNVPELDGRTGSFLCVEPVSAGGLTTNPHFANWFFREDGSPQWIVNEGWYPHPANGGDFDYEEVNFPQPAEQDMIDYFRILSGYGVNMVIDIAQLYARQTSITDPTFRWPWAVVDAKNNKIDKDRFNLPYYQRIDRVMQAAKQYGLFFAMELLYDNSVVRPREWSHHPLNVQNGGWLEGNEHGTGWDRMFDLDNAIHVRYTARYLKYTVARFAAYWNIFWSIGSENGNLIRLPQQILPHALFSPETTAAWYNYWGDFIARKDPYGRLRSFGDAGKQPLMVTTAHNNMIITQDPRNYRKHDPDAYYQAMNDFGEFYWHYGRPVVIGEMTAGTGGHYDMERRLYWIGLTAGYMMGRADRHFAPIVAGRLLESKKYQVEGEPPVYTDLANMTRFVKEQDVPFWRMRPSDHLINTAETMVYCLAADGEAWLIYFVHGGQAALDLPGAAYVWFNPATGQVTETGSCAAGRARFVAPDEGDWVLYLKATD